MSIIDILRLPEADKLELKKVQDEILQLAGSCKGEIDRQRLVELFKKQSEILNPLCLHAGIV